MNWLVKPFSMALRVLFSPLLPAAQIDGYVAGLIPPRRGALHRDGVRLGHDAPQPGPIRLVTFGQDSFNVFNLMQQLEKRSPFGVLPQYDIRVARRQCS